MSTYYEKLKTMKDKKIIITDRSIDSGKKKIIIKRVFKLKIYTFLYFLNFLIFRYMWFCPDSV